MPRRFVVPSLLALLAIASLCAVPFVVAAEEDDLTDHKLGRSDHKVTEALDECYEEMQRDAGITPAPIVDDNVWLRRVYLDLTGAPPSPEEIAAFNPSDRDPERSSTQRKRERLVKKLVKSKEFAEHMATWWTMILVGRPSAEIPNYAGYALRDYLRQAFNRNEPWNDIVRGLFADTPGVGSTPNWSYLQYLAASNDLGFMAGNAPRVFLGRQIQCAECHDHPYDPWTQDDFEAWQGFYKAFTVKRTRIDATRLDIVKDKNYSSLKDLKSTLGLKGKYKLPRYLDGREWNPKDGKVLREAMADWLTSNQWFAQMTVNRFMAYFLGVGFVTPVDDFNSFNDPTIPVIMKVMGKDFEASGYDLQHLVQAIVNSRIYQRESTTNPSNHLDRVYYSHQHVREMTPEMVYASILKATQVEILNPTAPGPIQRRPAQIDSQTELPEVESVAQYRLRLGALINNAWDGEDVTKTVDERGGNLARALMFMNGNILPQGLKWSLPEILKRPLSAKSRVQVIFKTVMGREPSEAEQEMLMETINEWAGAKRPDAEIYEDLFIALMCTPEFMNRA